MCILVTLPQSVCPLLIELVGNFIHFLLLLSFDGDDPDLVLLLLAFNLFL